MKVNLFAFAASAALLCLFGLPGCHTLPDRADNPVVGAWFVKVPGAPFEYQMYVFNADGTMQEANPDAGDANTSDSDGIGVWISKGDRIVGKFVEVTADRTTRAFVSRGEISFDFKVENDTFEGSATGRFFNVDGAPIREPVHASLEGQRVKPE